ncbi:DUF1016 domain-containing protein [Acidithiobacillus marinus]|nr:DUF1016 domain-containing protein [Acidithiobacillus marinus]
MDYLQSFLLELGFAFVAGQQQVEERTLFTVE